jgi:hypothetical protein
VSGRNDLKHRQKAGVALAMTALMVLLVGEAAPGGAQPSSQQIGGVRPAATGCTVTFTNAGPPLMSACVSGHGNINSLRYSPSGASDEHIAVGTIAEGYCLKDTGTGTAYYDNGPSEAGWGVASQSSTAITTTVTRTTTDGFFTLTQNIFFKYGSRLVLVGNLVKNNDTVPHTVVFDRAADLDVNGSSGGDTFDVIGGSVLARETDGVLLTSLGDPALVRAKGAELLSTWLFTGSHSCSHSLQPLPDANDDAAVIKHIATIGPGSTVTFRVGYRVL